MNTQAAAPQQATIVPNTHTATLVRGDSYFLGNTRFEPGKAIPVPAYIKEHLERVAVDMVDVEGEAEAKQKFKFAALPTEKAEGAEKPARRTRAPRATAAAEDTSDE